MSDVLASRIRKCTQFIRECNEIARLIHTKSRVSKVRVKKLEAYRLFFKSLKTDPAFKKLADIHLSILDQNIELVALYRVSSDSEELKTKAQQIKALMKERFKIMEEVKQNGV
jgi:CRISPR/Cas system-associated protein Cas5 (RAMP superfamily)